MSFLNRILSGIGLVPSKQRSWAEDGAPWLDEIFPDPIKPKRGILLQRSHRGDDRTFANPTSWLGGLPTLGAVDWPRDSTGALMTHVLSVDLAGLNRAVRWTGLPKKGQLAVFLPLVEPKMEGRVLHLTTPGDTIVPTELTVSRSGAPAVSTDDPHPDKRVLPQWPVRFRHLPLPNNPPAPPRVTLMASHLAEHLPNGDAPWLWDSLQRFCLTLPRDAATLDKAMERKAKQLALGRKRLAESKRPEGMDEAAYAKSLETAAAANEKLERTFATLRDQRGAYASLIAEYIELAARHDPWDVIAPQDLARFQALMDSLRYAEFRDDNGPFGPLYGATRARHYRSLAEPVAETLVVMAGSEPAVFRKLPVPVQNMIIAEQDAETSPRGVQMFGHGTAVQDAVELNADKHILFEFGPDALIGMNFGSVKLWITPADLKAQAWDKVTVTFEYD